MAITKRKPVPQRFLVRPTPLKGESLRGFLLRIAEHNGCGKGTNFLTILTGNYSSTHRVSDQGLANIALSLALSRRQVEAMNYRPVGGGAKNQCLFFGHTIAMSHLRSNQPAICPDCLSEVQAISGLWDLRAVCVCPRHAKWLIDRCPACGESFKWNRTRVASCQCGFDLRNVETEPAPAEVLALTTLLHEVALNDLPTFDERSLGYPEGMRKYPLNELLALFRYTANVLLAGYPVDQQACKHVTKAFSKHSQATVLLAKLLNDWPNSFWLVLAHFSEYDAVDIVLTASEFNSGYRRVLQVALEPKPLCSEVPGFLKQALLQFRDDHCIYDTVEGRYLNPSSAWCSSHGQRVLKLGDCLKALGLQEKYGQDEIAPFSTFLRKKSEQRFAGACR